MKEGLLKRAESSIIRISIQKSFLSAKFDFKSPFAKKAKKEALFSFFLVFWTKQQRAAKEQRAKQRRWTHSVGRTQRKYSKSLAHLVNREVYSKEKKNNVFDL